MSSSNESTALLVIDVQVGCFSLSGEVHEPTEFLSRVSELIARARSSAVPVIYLQHLAPPGQVLEAGSEGGQIHPAVAPLAGESVIQKEESDGFLGTELHAELEKRGVQELVVCGMHTEYCVDTTCRRAHGLGYKVFLVQDAHTTADAASLSAEQIIEHHNETLGGTYVVLSSTADVFP